MSRHEVIQWSDTGSTGHSLDRSLQGAHAPARIAPATTIQFNLLVFDKSDVLFSVLMYRHG